MEHFNAYSPRYLSALREGNGRYKVRLDLLSNGEQVIDEITKDVSLTAQGQITINYEQITRRSCTLTLIDVDKKYLPHKNSGFWINRKFKLWLGLAVNSTSGEQDIYWWSEGIFYTLSVNALENSTISIEAVDKGGVLDGTLKLNLSESQYLIRRGALLPQVIKDTLALNTGCCNVCKLNDLIYGDNTPIDNIPPIIGIEYFNTRIVSEISVDANNYISTIFEELADIYAADCYYDVEGHFVFKPYLESSGYQYAPSQWSFNNLSSFFEDVNYSYSYDGINAVTYYTNTSEAGVKNVAWTAYNTNPLSPLNISCGIRRDESQEIPYYDTQLPENSPYTEEEIRRKQQEQAIKDCRAAANHHLLKKSLIGMQLNFNCPIIPHLDVNKTIEITDEAVGLDGNVFIIQSITIPLSAAKMSISATNINWLPNGMSFCGVAEVVEGGGE